MANAEHDLKKIRYITEGTLNAGAAGAKQTTLRVLKYDCKPIIGKAENRELDSTKIRNRPKEVSKAFEINMDVYMRYEELDVFLAASLRDAAYSAPIDITDTVYSMADVDNSINDSGAGFVTDAYVATQLLRTSGFTLAVNNSISKISTLAAGKMVLLGIDAADEVAGDTVSVDMGAQIVTGTTIPTFAFEEELSNLTIFRETRGCALTNLTITVSDDEELVVSMTFMCISQVSAGVTYGDGAPTAVSANEIFMYQQMDVVYENSGEITLSNAFSLSINPKIRPETRQLGTDLITEFKSGDHEVTGSIEFLLANDTIYDKIAASTESSLIVYFEDSAGNAYAMEVVALEYDDISENDGKEEDILFTANFNAHKDSTELINMRIAKFPA